MTAGRYSVSGVDLPPSAMITSGDGVTLQKTLTRAVESDEWAVEGDGRAVPAELVLTMTIEGSSEADAANQIMLLWGLLSSAARLDRDDRTYRRLLGAKSMVTTHDYGDASTQTLTITLLPLEGYWRSAANDTLKAF